MQPTQEERLPLRKLWLFVRPAFAGMGLRYAGIIVLLVIAAIGGVGEPLIYGKVVDAVVRAIEGNQFATLWRVLAPLLIVWISLDIVSIAARELANVLSWSAANAVWSRFWNRTLARVFWWDPQRFSLVSVGALAKQLDTAGSATWRLGGETLQRLLPVILSAIAFFVVGFSLDWRMTLASLVAIPPLFILSFLAQRAVERKQDTMNAAWEMFLQKFVEILANIVPIQSFGAEARMAKMHAELGSDAMEKQKHINTLWALLAFSTSFVRFFGRFFLLGVGLWLISDGTLSLGVLITFMGMLDMILAPFEFMLADVMRKLSETRSAFARVLPDLEKENAIKERRHPKALGRVRGHVRFEKVSYRYPEKNEYALKNITLTIPDGKSIALVGPSGSGKSTLVKFINRFLDPSSGNVFLDGKNIRDVRIADVRRAIGFVHQESVLFNDTLLENIRFAKPEATLQEVEEACKKAQAHDFIHALPLGYETVVGERGVRLSGGERQRLAIARVFLANQPVLVLDESTSALDSETELKLQMALKKVMRGRTTILIAHRLSTIYMADQIAVMERGEIIEKGTHQELLKEGGLYNRLWNMQSGGYFVE